MNIGRVIEDATTAFDRMFQKTYELVHYKSTKTIDQDLVQLFAKVDAMEKVILPVYRCVTLYFDMDENELVSSEKERERMINRMAQAMLDSRGKIEDSPIPANLMICGEALQKISKEEMVMLDTLSSSFLRPVKHFLTTEMGQVNEARQSLEEKRLDLDAARRRNSEKDAEFIKASESYSKQHDMARTKVLTVISSEATYHALMKDLVLLLRNYHLKCGDILSQAYEKYH